MKGMKILKWCWFPVLLLILVAWYRYPVRFLNGIPPEKVAAIQIFDGNTGCALEVADRETISRIVEEIRSVPMRRGGISLMKVGYRFRLTFLGSDGRELTNFIVNSADTIRKDPFFYRSEEGGLCFDLLWDLLDAAYGYSH